MVATSDSNAFGELDSRVGQLKVTSPGDREENESLDLVPIFTPPSQLGNAAVELNQQQLDDRQNSGRLH